MEHNESNININFVEEHDVYSNVYKKKVQKQFIEVFKQFSEVINDNVLIISEKYIYEYQKNHKKFECKLNKKQITTSQDISTEQDPPWIQHDEYKYMIKKINDTQTQLNSYSHILDYYYIHHKWWYDRISMVIIIISSGLSFFQTLSITYNFGKIEKVGSVFISTSIAALTAILKFKNYKEKAEEVVRIKEKVLSSQSKLYLFEKDLKSKLYLYNNNDEPPE